MKRLGIVFLLIPFLNMKGKGKYFMLYEEIDEHLKLKSENNRNWYSAEQLYETVFLLGKLI